MIVITPCASARFRELVRDTTHSLRASGFVVLPPTLLSMAFTDTLNADQALLAWKGGTYSHFQRVSKCNVCLICNAGGYCGVSTTLELGYAAAVGKLIVALRHDNELARESLFDHVLDTEDPACIAEKMATLLGMQTASTSG